MKDYAPYVEMVPQNIWRYRREVEPTLQVNLTVLVS